ncbi:MULTISPECIES: hypothetical protein [unclassified Curtobacterium]|uniref:hypothetical protein n=1 Tax=unclassified Curtobacterium TaxID=257496 RepID=UPI000DAA7456|nr:MULTISPECIES: hypothetical protein [unclassified Curtobacterium]PZE25365.1 hypothetical protein DEI86_11155 [Curtobacterium sp. MCBD17_028]PZE75389.1 hypothetical protein DEI82_08630 [Curtobacterium sp. MCBD17_019]PZF58003.1 hypothetical protein DEI92_12100 [Curtobacterium sp. MCBD17_034]PZF61423.1 hypothetical protein DEI81_11630 [Curtobacterium sp. MCBD17_013]PZM33194.1 hypothetical protein DEI90_13865 [Curtobacterium sp. MCBD17_031]
MTSTIDFIQISGTVLDAPVLTTDDLVEFVVADDVSRREFLVRLPRTELGAHVVAGAHVQAAGAAGWVVPGRPWRHEPSRTILQAHDVQLAALAFAA